MKKASELIVDAWYLSGIVAREFEEVTGAKMTDGLTLLRDILEEKAINGIYIPYYSHAEFDTVPGQETYDIDGLIDLRAFTFNIGTVRYSMRRDTQKRYFDTGRVDDIDSLPFHYYAERQLNGMRLYLYFLPSEVFKMKITGKYKFLEIDLDSDIEDQVDKYYISYLKYELAKRMCDFYGYPFDRQKEETLSVLQNKVANLVGTDMSINKDTAFGRRGAFRYGQANLGRGWEPPRL